MSRGTESSAVVPSLPAVIRAGPVLHAAAAAAGFGAIAFSVVVLDHAGAPDAGLRVMGVAIPVVVGLLRLAYVPRDRFALLLLGSGVLWSATALAEVSDPTAYSIGRTAAWLIEPAIVFLLLAFPLGRVERAVEQRLAGAAFLLVGLLYLPTAFLADFPVPSPWASCGTSCPDNALALTDGGSGFVSGLVLPLREVLTFALFAAVTVCLARRAQRSGPINRRILLPIVTVAMVRAISLGAYVLLRRVSVESTATEALGWIYILSLPMITLAFAGGLLAHRLFVAGALEELTRTFALHPSARELREGLARALQDPRLEIRFWVPGAAGGWTDEHGQPAPSLRPGPERAVTEVGTGDRRLAAIVHEKGIAEDRALLDAVTAYALTALENRQLIGRLQSSLNELTASRARLVTVADEERRRIERDLHDGAQQRLVALQIKLELLAERLDEESPQNADRARALEAEIAETLDEVRRFGRGVYPALLADRGLKDALHAAARTSPLPTTVDAHLDCRYPKDIEATVYFTCLEALQNAMKHADGATAVHIAVSGNGSLRFEVRDDGAGFSPDDVQHGAGLTNIGDRVHALGGTLDVTSRPGGGTRVSGVIPLP